MQGLEATKGGSHRQAIQLFTQALQKDASNTQFYLNRASAHAILGDLGAALADFNSVLRLQPNNADALAHRGKLSAMTGDTAAALRDWSAAASQGHKLANSWLCTHLSEQGLEASRRGEYQQAIAFFSQALQRESHRKKLFLNRACAHAALGNMGAAIEDYNAVLRLQPNLPEALAQRGRAKAALGLTDDAKRDWKQAGDQGHQGAQAWLQKLLELEHQDNQRQQSRQNSNSRRQGTPRNQTDKAQSPPDSTHTAAPNHQQSSSRQGNSNAEAAADWKRAAELGRKDVPTTTQPANIMKQASAIAMMTFVCLAFGWLIYEVTIRVGIPIWIARALVYIAVGVSIAIANNRE